MSSRLTFASVKDVIAPILTMNTSDTRLPIYVSRAQERLLYKGKWVGTYGRYRVCIQDSCLTWPREIETIEAAAMCNIPIDIRNDWYEFLGSGPGIQTENSCTLGGFGGNGWWGFGFGMRDQLIDRGDAIAFDDVRGTGKKLSLYADSASDAGEQVLVRYYDSTGNKVYSTVSGETIEGEYLTLVAPPAFVESSNEVLAGGYYGVVKPLTARMVRVYEYDTVALTRRPLAYYEPDETNPMYRRSLLPGISDTCNGSSSDSCSSRTIDIVGKFRQRAVRKDSDELIIQSAEALRLMCQALRKEENNLWDDAARYEASATRVLDEQLAHWMGDGKVAPMRIIGAEVQGAGVLNVI